MYELLHRVTRGREDAVTILLVSAQLRGRRQRPPLKTQLHSLPNGLARACIWLLFLQMVDEFDAVCFEKKTKAIYGPVRTATGAHLIFLHSRIEK